MVEKPKLSDEDIAFLHDVSQNKEQFRRVLTLGSNPETVPTLISIAKTRKHIRWLFQTIHQMRTYLLGAVALGAWFWDQIVEALKKAIQ